MGDDTVVKENWEWVIEKIKGRLDKWKWLAPKMSYRGHILIMNNLVTSSLWHKIASVDPPINTPLTKVQSISLDDFWNKLHWVPQGVLYLPKGNEDKVQYIYKPEPPLFHSIFTEALNQF